MPLLIGGATTSRVHTAVKIDPNYKGGPVVHVNDASRAVGVASSLLSPERREAYAADIRAEYAKISAAHFRAQADKKRLKLADARANAVKIDFAKTPPKKPAFLGIRSFDAYDLAELAEYIDWTPFFQTWELTGRFPAILDDPKIGEVARSLYDDARKMLDLIVKEKWFTARATIGFWPANADGDDIAVYADDSREARRSRPSTRCASNWRSAKAASTPRCRISSRRRRPACRIISAPSSSPPGSARTWSPTASRTPMTITPRSCARRWPIVWRKPLPSGCTSACARNSGATRRTRRWPPDQLILEQYAGIRPAPGYPAQPDHTEKATLFRLLDAENTAGVDADRELCDVAGLVGVGALFQPSRKLLFRRRQDRARPGRGLRRAQGHERGRDRALAGAGAELHSRRRSRPRRRSRRRRRWRPSPPTTSPRIRRGALARCIWPGARRPSGRRARFLPFSPCGRRWREAPDEGSHPRRQPLTRLDRLRRDPPSPTRGEGKRQCGSASHEILLLLAIAGEFSRSHRAQSEKCPGRRRVRRPRRQRASRRRISPDQSADGAAGAGRGRRHHAVPVARDPRISRREISRRRRCCPPIQPAAPACARWR